MRYKEIVKKLKSLCNPGNIAGMARFGINPCNALEIRKIDSKSARWIANDTIRELRSEKVQKRLS